MSASLVGSEMCIRDSAHATNPARERTCAIAIASATLRSCPAKHRNPVSYTHLTLPTICSV
eukprot:7377181-Alexandrium_andersonii.AAC.1